MTAVFIGNEKFCGIFKIFKTILFVEEVASLVPCFPVLPIISHICDGYSIVHFIFKSNNIDFNDYIIIIYINYFICNHSGKIYNCDKFNCLLSQIYR